MKTLLIALMLPVILTGCATNQSQDKALLEAYKAFIGQQNTAEIARMRTTGDGKISISLSGDAELAISTPVPAKTAMTRDPNVLHSIVEGATKLGIGYFLSEAFMAGTSSRTVTQPAPLVVRPEVIQVPVAGQ